ncbi:MAG TPA: Crp/Fnr family transcriptional regulator [Phototrophicaceae bacterium]|jgi:CRP/FNR family transcriptional regulator|nr:Crp/Fnr family transcriptional regulator [Phototrophicaceae bacterium]
MAKSSSVVSSKIQWDDIPYFADLDAQGYRKIEETAHRRSYQAGTTIFNERATCGGFHILLEGMVRIYRVNPEGRLHTLSLLLPVATFNEVAAIDGGYNPFNAVAVTNVELMVVSHERLLALLSGEPRLLNNYVQALAHMNRDYIERLEDMTFRSIPSRLAKLFLHETTYADHISEAPSRLTQEEIASILGTTREVVGRALRGLLNAGLLKKKGRKVYISDRGGLEILAETNMMPDRSGNPVVEKRVAAEKHVKDI